jgi:hypothetical protein
VLRRFLEFDEAIEIAGFGRLNLLEHFLDGELGGDGILREKGACKGGGGLAMAGEEGIGLAEDGTDLREQIHQRGSDGAVGRRSDGAFASSQAARRVTGSERRARARF